MSVYTTSTPITGSRLSARAASDTVATRVLELAKQWATRLPVDKRDDAAQDIAVRALRILSSADVEDGPTWSTHGAVKSAAVSELKERERNEARDNARGYLWDPTDAADVKDLEEKADRNGLASWSAPAPDALTTWSMADTLADVLEEYVKSAHGRERSRRMRVALALGKMRATGREPKALSDDEVMSDLADLYTAVVESYAHRSGTFKHPVAITLEGHRVVAAWARHRTLARMLSATTHGGPVGRSTFPMGLHAHSGKSVAGRLVAVPCDCARCIGRDLEDDYRADAAAEMLTPLGPVAQVNTRKRKRDGSVGSPTMPVGIRRGWREKTTKSVHES